MMKLCFYGGFIVVLLFRLLSQEAVYKDWAGIAGFLFAVGAAGVAALGNLERVSGVGKVTALSLKFLDGLVGADLWP